MKSKFSINVVRNMDYKSMVCKFGIANPEQHPELLIANPEQLIANPERRSEQHPEQHPEQHYQMRQRHFYILPKVLVFSVFVLFSSILNPLSAQSKLRASGFVEYLNNNWIPPSSYAQYGISDWQSQSTIYNRLNIWWNPNENIEFHAGMRNNFAFGPMVATYNKLLPYDELVTYDDGYMDLTWKLSSNNSHVLYTNFDRLYFRYTKSKFDITIGRQRINWGTNLVWNPNDIFNAFNYFDFNYIERPGSDAIKIEYYTGDFSSLQLAAKLNYVQEINDSLQIEKNLKLTAALLYKFNIWSYDFQFFAGNMIDDITAGFGWAGNIGGAGFTGELSWFRNRKNFSDSSGIVIASVSGNYVFKNSIMLDLSMIYNSDGSTGLAYENNALIGSGFLTNFSSSLNVKRLTPSRLDLFAQLSYPATPLINIAVSGIYNPWDNSGYFGPSANISISDNISLMLVGQIFSGDKLSEFGDIGQMYFLDLKWSF